MAKFCSKCNSPINEGETKCSYCGTPANSAPANAKKQQLDVANLMKDPKVKKFAPVAVVALLVAVVVIIVAIASNAGYKGVVNKYMKSYINNNPDKFVKTLSATWFSEDFDEEEMEEFKEDFDDEVKDMYDELEEEYGKGVKVKYEILGSYDIDEERMESIEDVLDERDVDYGKEAKGKKVVLLVTIKGDDKEITSSTEVTLVKEDGKWKVYRGLFF